MDAKVCIVALVVTLVIKIEEVQHPNVTQAKRCCNASVLH